MIDFRSIRKLGVLVVALGVVWGTSSCGGNGAANNDEGMSITFLGLFSSSRLTTNNGGGGTVGGGGAGGNQTPGTQGCGQLPRGVSGGYVQLGDVEPELDRPDAPTISSGVVSVVGVQNNLYGQAFRAERLLLDYFIPGASAQPPSTTVPVFLIAGPAESAEQVSDGAAGGSAGSQAPSPGLRRPLFTSLPPSFSNLCNRALARATIVPPTIREWLNFNRDALPAPPFKMEVTVRVSGISSSGNNYETNDGTFDYDVLPENYMLPTPGEETVTPAAMPAEQAVYSEGEDWNYSE